MISLFSSFIIATHCSSELLSGKDCILSVSSH